MNKLPINQEGNLLLEILVVLMFVGILFTSVSAFPYSLTRSSQDISNRQIAQTYATELVSALRGIQYENWILIPNSPYYNPYRIEKNASGWYLTSGSEMIGKFRRELSFHEVKRDVNGNISENGNVDPNTKKAVVTVHWNSVSGELSTSLSTFVSNWQDSYGKHPEMSTIAEWRLDENSGNVAYDSVGDNDASIEGIKWVPGIKGRALLWDDNDDYAVIGPGKSFILPESFSLEFWTKPVSDSGTSVYNVFFKDGLYGFHIDANSLSFGTNGDLITAVPLNNRYWNHVVLTYDNLKLENEFKLYVNGNLITSFVMEIETNDINEPLFLAKGYRGYLDEIYLYDYVLDFIDIKDNYDTRILPENLIASWEFDESGGMILYDTVRTEDGVINGASWSTGYKGSALDFNGQNNYVMKESSLITNYPFAISAWINTSVNNNKDMTIFSLTDNSRPNLYFQIILNNKGFLGVHCRAPVNRSFYGTTDLRDGEWHHVTIVVAGKTDRRIYIDGVLESSDNSSSNMPSSINQWSIGYLGTRNPSSYFEGTIDYVKIWGSNLNDQDVTNLYNSY